jgi:hypothetical protein
VGDPYALTVERPATLGPFFLLRGVEWDEGRAAHQGSDIGCGLSGGLVRAAAAGLVVRVADHGDHGGYGTHVVLAHRLPGGVLAYSVYAHLRLASTRVKPGQFVPAGTTLARVGMTGRATTPHLHFEVRTASDPAERWEKARVEEPLAFVNQRLPAHRRDTTGIAAYLEWAECASLLTPEAQGDDVLTHGWWWRMLAVVGHGSLLDPALPATELRDSLVGSGLLPPGAADRRAGEAMDWPELAREVSRLRQTGPRGGPAPLRRAEHRGLCEARFGSPTPAQRVSELSDREGRPSLTDAVVLVADLAGPPPEPAKKSTKAKVKQQSGGARPDSSSREKSGSSADSAAKITQPKRGSGSAGKAKQTPNRADTSAVSRPASRSLDSVAKPARGTGADSLKRKTPPASKPAPAKTPNRPDSSS